MHYDQSQKEKIDDKIITLCISVRVCMRTRVCTCVKERKRKERAINAYLKMLGNIQSYKIHTI